MADTDKRWVWMSPCRAEQSTNGKLQPGYPLSWTVKRNSFLVRSSSSVPNWDTKIQRMTSATGGLSVWTEDVSDFFFYSTCRYNNGTSSSPNWVEKVNHGLTSFPLGHDPSVVLSDEGAIQHAKGTWSNRLREKQNGVLAGVSIMEARETYDMVKGRSKQMVDGMADYLKRHVTYRRKHKVDNSLLKQARSLAHCAKFRDDHTLYKKCKEHVSKNARQKIADYEKATGDLWLEYSFGWRAAVDDIQTWAEEIERNPSRGYRDYDTLRASGKEETKRIARVNIYGVKLPGLVPGWQWERETRLKVSVKYYGAFLVSQSLGNLRAAGFGFGIHDFVPTVWELLPWSWVVDSFSNIGNVLSALTARTAGLRWSQTTTVSELTSTLSAPAQRPYLLGSYPSVYAYLKGSYGERIASSYSETVSGKIGLKTFRLIRAVGTPTSMVPELEFRMASGPQAYNIGALFASKVRPLKRLLD